jgi:hypothetical protein
MQKFSTRINLEQQPNITLMWVPRHQGIDGNEKADELGKFFDMKKFRLRVLVGTI